ncbi:MAG: BON domain-containing protein [Planctomycetia bacterium]|nr:BON domain-containing protein [Planctomycetia bacterium]
MSTISEFESQPVHEPHQNRWSLADCDVARVSQQKLRTSPYLSLRELQCTFHEGVLTLYGRVPTYYLKQLAQTVVARTHGVEELVNQIEVAGPRYPAVPRIASE